MAATAQQPPNAFAHRGAGGALLRSFVARTRPVTESVQLAMLHTRALDELAEHLEARCAADTAELRRLTAPSHKRAPPGGHPPRTGGAAGAALMSRIAAASACAVDVADAKVQVLDAAGVQVDTAIRDLDRRARLLETLLQEQGVAAGDAAVAAAAAAAAAKPGGRARRGAAGGESVDGDGGVGESAVAAGAGGRRSTALDVRAQVEQRVAAAASQSLTDALEHDPGSLLHEPVYCSCRQVRGSGCRWAGGRGGSNFSHAPRGRRPMTPPSQMGSCAAPAA